jgi:formylglycine-generating enzyme required for sulfatase activity
LGATLVTIAGTSADFTVVSDTQITATAPAHASGGMFNVTVTTPGGTALSNQSIAFWQVPPWPCTVIEVMPDPAVVYDPALRTQILATGLPWRITESAVGIEMLLIPNGTFLMGCSASLEYGCYGDESPNHWVTLTKPFYLGRYEVTQAQWQARTGSNPSSFQPPHHDLDLSRPVENVSWNNIVNDFQPGTGLRLPTEAEWEYACRAGTTTAFHGYAAMPGGFDDDSLTGNIGWYALNVPGGTSGTTQPVGQKPANGFGLYDMAGNVIEWCADRYKGGYYSDSPAVDPPGPSSGINRVLRGGSWYYDGDDLRSSYRVSNSPGDTYVVNGFRVARTP